MTAISKITSTGQTTIPQEIRIVLKVKPGDQLTREIGQNGLARVRRVQPFDIDCLRAPEGTLGEWSGSADEDAYRAL